MRKNFLGLLVLFGGLVGADAQTMDVRYEVRFKDAPVATQLVSFTQHATSDAISAEFAADLHVFVAVNHYAEKQSATHRSDGTVTAFRSARMDGLSTVKVEGRLGADDVLQVTRQDAEATTTNFIPRADYDFSSLFMYGHDPVRFLPTNTPARVLNLLEGRVVPVDLQSISESITVERQHVETRHLVWTEGEFISHTWHPDWVSKLPSRFIRHNGSGVFEFTLQR